MRDWIKSKLPPRLARFLFRIAKRTPSLPWIVAIVLALQPLSQIVSSVTPWARGISCFAFELYCAEIQTATSFVGRPRQYFSQRDAVQFNVAVHSRSDNAPLSLSASDIGVYDPNRGDLAFTSSRTASFNEPITLVADSLET